MKVEIVPFLSNTSLAPNTENCVICVCVAVLKTNGGKKAWLEWVVLVREGAGKMKGDREERERKASLMEGLEQGGCKSSGEGRGTIDGIPRDATISEILQSHH